MFINKFAIDKNDQNMIRCKLRDVSLNMYHSVEIDAPKNDISHNYYDDFLFEYKNALSSEYCDYLINIYNDPSNNKIEGITNSGPHKAKITTEILLESKINTKFYKEYNYIFNVLNSYLTKQENIFKGSDMSEFRSGNKFSLTEKDISYGYSYYYSTKDFIVAKYTKNVGMYNWHHDGYDSSVFPPEIVNTSTNIPFIRMYTFLFYLNDIEEGGETEFLHRKIKPEKGKLLLFPATFIYPHKGCMPISNDKYICTGWLFA